MVRAPCCEKMGLKKGPWTKEEDQVLIDYINTYGHGNWRALPKQAGLLRCGKSCRLRWTNYLRPDIKRGNFSQEEEDTIISLHQELGNRWSAIAARLPGRTDNEIKNIWHTRLKKRLRQGHESNPTTSTCSNVKKQSKKTSKSGTIIDHNRDNSKNTSNPVNSSASYSSTLQHWESDSPSPLHSSTTSDVSSASTSVEDAKTDSICDSLEMFPEVDENFWMDVFSPRNSTEGSEFSQFSSSGVSVVDRTASELVYGFNSNMQDCMDFWQDIFSRAGELSEQLPEF